MSAKLPLKSFSLAFTESRAWLDFKERVPCYPLKKSISKKQKEKHLSRFFLAEKECDFFTQAHVPKVVGSNPTSLWFFQEKGNITEASIQARSAASLRAKIQQETCLFFSIFLSKKKREDALFTLKERTIKERTTCFGSKQTSKGFTFFF